ncbi:MAG TPA: malto-oligosyltrehalose synthase [Terriglobales bacterium]|nr:malto-oligosyltrehalose synthase [Terriglobales bacterium]
MVARVASQAMSRPDIPLSTYRLQFNRDFTFAKATELVPYLAQLGITHCYASPYLRARPGSTHGYDIIDHNTLNPEIGTPEDFERFVQTLQAHGMGHILDLVPNHMGVMGSDNSWWLDVLENGQASKYADFFDIDWEPLKDELQGKVLIPVLGDQYGIVLDRGELKLTFDREKGEFSIYYFQHRFPVNPKEYPRILSLRTETLEASLGADNEQFLELQSLSAAFSHLPVRQDANPQARIERNRDKEIHKRRLAALCAQSPEICEFMEANVRQISGVPGDSRTFDALHELIKAQAYRLAYWRVAADDINYRRFFDINDLAALRMENFEVFCATHKYVLDLVKAGKIDGLRIDHPDGLYDPAQYFHRLQCGRDCRAENQQCEAKSVYVAIEKILTGDEHLPESWPVHGTTGYDFLNLVNGLFVDPDARDRMDRIYRAFIGHNVDFDLLAYECKKLVMDRALASELNVLANLLSRIALADRHTCDFTVNNLRDALMEIVASFPVYRTYVTADSVSADDRKYITQAVELARERSSVADGSVFDFIQHVLLTEQSQGRGQVYHERVSAFASKFQQFTSAVMAKGLEDTSFYRFDRLVSLNEVGGDPRRFGVSPQDFHCSMHHRARHWPQSMLSTSTHDTKRSEDVRARINVLSEIPMLWRKRVRHWRELNQRNKLLVNGAEAPTRNDEYLFYQTLIGIWPWDEGERSSEVLRTRLGDYMVKATRESKAQTSWANQNKDYEDAVSKFVSAVLEPSAANAFLKEFSQFQEYVARIGIYNSLSQTVIKLASPGVPDIYQGAELWDFSLVDPDNRRPVDYDLRRRLLSEFPEWMNSSELADKAKMIVRSMHDGRIKLFVTYLALNARKQNRQLFQEGSYDPLPVKGAKSEHILAFARNHEGKSAVVAVPRFTARLLQRDHESVTAPAVWEDTRIAVAAPATYRNVFTAELVASEQAEGENWISANRLFATFPVALLVSEEEPGCAA